MIKFLKRHCITWHQAWAQVKEKYGDHTCYNAQAGESWQYMSSVVKEDGRVEHQFRHRCLPGKKSGEYEYFAAHGTYDPNDYQ